MCETALRAPPTPQEASIQLARLMERQLGYIDGYIDPIALRLFVRSHWGKVAAYAHIIHDENC